MEGVTRLKGGYRGWENVGVSGWQRKPEVAAPPPKKNKKRKILDCCCFLGSISELKVEASTTTYSKIWGRGSGVAEKKFRVSEKRFKGLKDF